MIRNSIEFVVLIALGFIMSRVILSGGLSPMLATTLVIVLAFAKSAFFGGENIQQLWKATRENIAYYRFLIMMLVNMSQIILSFGIDYYCLYLIDAQSFSSIDGTASEPVLVFEFFYFSVLNFTFFGYGDITPQTVAAKLLTMTEIVLAFATVIFLLSDFISLKESLAGPRGRN